MRKSIWNRRIPSIFGLLFLVFAIGITAWFGQNLSQLRGRAAAGETPKNVKISNISSTSFTVSYSTDSKVTSSIAFGDASASGHIVMDDRDKAGSQPTAHNIHYITITNLNPGTTYYFAIQSGSITAINNDLPYQATTASSSSALLNSQQPVTGTINLPDGTIPLEGIVYISTDDSQEISGLIQIDGSYSIPTGSLLNSDLNSPLLLKPDTILHITTTNGINESHVSLFAKNSNPVPLTTLSKDYDFTNGSISPSANSIASGSATASASGSLTPTEEPTILPLFTNLIATGPAILTPRDDQEFHERRPTFSGTALPNEVVQITIESNPKIQTIINSDSLGNWEFKPNVPLDLGNHALTVVSKDAKGVLQTLSRNFVVHAEGSQFNEPSVPPLESPTPTITATIPPTMAPTFTPAITASPTAYLSPTPSTDLTQAWNLTQAYTNNRLTQSAPSIMISIDPASLTATAIAERKTSPPGNYTLVFAGIITILSITGGLMLFFF